MVDLWFNLIWSAHTGTGPIILQLPFKALNTIGTPWVGPVWGNVNLGAGYTNMFMVVNGNTNDGVLLKSGSGVAFGNVTMSATGEMVGHLRYVGTEFE
jgi:hypothetical protein